MDLSHSEYKEIVESSPNMIWRAGLDAKCNYFNDTWLAFTGRKLEEELGDGWASGVHTEDFTFCLETYVNAFKKQEKFEMEYRLKRHDGEWRWINDRGVPFFDEIGNFKGYIGSCMDVTEKIEGKKLTEMAHNDLLTGLYNRNYLEYLMDYEFHKARQDQSDLTAMMIDIDKFKFINDHFGHRQGDDVLRQVACIISRHIRKTDIAGRYGGDEFLVLLPKTTLEDAQMIAHRILNTLPEVALMEPHLAISVSIGIARKTDERAFPNVIEKADKAMYQAKHEGGNRFNLFTA